MKRVIVAGILAITFGVALAGCSPPPRAPEATETKVSPVVTSSLWAWNGKTRSWPTGVGMINADGNLQLSAPFPLAGQTFYRGAFLAGAHGNTYTHAFGGVKTWKPVGSSTTVCEAFVEIFGSPKIQRPMTFACDQTEWVRVRINPIGGWNGFLDVQFIIDKTVNGTYVGSDVVTVPTNWPTATWSGDSGGLVVERSGTAGVPYFFHMQGWISFTEHNASGQPVNTTPVMDPKIVRLVGISNNTLVDSTTYTAASGTTFSWSAPN